MKTGLVSLNPTVGAINDNLQKILHFIDEAVEQKCDLIVFPELALIGYPPKDYLFYTSVLAHLNKALDALKRRSKKIVILVGGISKNRTTGPSFKNTAFIFQNGQKYVYHKQLLPNYDVFDEQRYFDPGKTPLILKLHGKKCGITICEDIWTQSQLPEHRYAQDPLEVYAQQGLDLLINLSASPYELGKAQERHKLLKQVSHTLGCVLIYVNQSGANDELIFDGSCLVYDAHGQRVFESRPFTEALAVVELNHLRSPRTLPDMPPAEELTEALVTGVRDYVHKTGFEQVLLGLSGGIDSAVVACLACQALGPDNVLAVLLPSRYSSKGSLVDSERLAKNLGLQTLQIRIEDFQKDYERLFTKIFGKNTHDLTLQNIQARIRGNILMAISNNTHRLLLNTTNKSELALGYGTLYGDLCGALAVLSDVTKTLVYELAHWINRENEIIPQEILSKPPSAELKFNQKDTDSLPPYNVLDPWLEQFVTTAQIPEDIGDHSFTTQQLTLKVTQSEFKRSQAPLGLRVSRKAFGSGRRFPIAAKIDL